jgi:hypothetical protein
MPAPGQRKLPEAERRRIADRYHEWKRNMPKVICAEHGINRWTMLEYAREFGKAS